MWRMLFLSILICAAAKPKPHVVNLDYLIIDVNGHARVVRSGNELVVIQGDKIIVKDAIGVGQNKIGSVNIVGYVPPGTSGPVDDRNFIVDTAKELDQAKAIDKQGEIFEVQARARGTLLGVVFLKVKHPELRYAVCRINGKDTILRPGELLRVKRSDSFKLKEVVSNLDELGDEVTFDMVPVGGFKEIPNLEFYEIRFSRAGNVFARIPLEIDGT